MLDRPGTCGNRTGSDLDPIDPIKHRTEPEQVPGPRVLVDPWRPLQHPLLTKYRIMTNDGIMPTAKAITFFPKWRRMESVFKHGVSCLEMCPDLRQSHLYPRINFTRPEFDLCGPINLYTASGPAEYVLAPEKLHSSRRVRGQCSRLITGWLALNLDWKDSH